MSYIGSSTTTKRSESSASRLSVDGDTTEDGGDDRDESKRKSRNLSEKKRRDQFNVLINELCSMVSTTPRKMDKSTVLKATISFLKAHNELSVQSQAQETQETWKPSFLSNEEFTHLMLEALDGFIIVVSTSGAILYVSEGITSLLGHLPSDLVPSTIYSLIPSEEKNELFSILSTVTEDNERQHVSLSLNFRLGGLEMDGDNPTYQPVKLAGYFKRWISPTDCNSGNGSGGESRSGEDGFQESNDGGNGNFVLIATGRLHEAELVREMSVVVDSANNEFSSRHSLEWKFLFLDHRAPPIIGYLPFEVLGTCGYDYYHIDDLEKIATCHEALMQKGEGTSCYYRFLTKGQQWIWLQTRFYITYHQWNSKPEFIVCTHRVVDYADVMKELRGDKCIDSPRLSSGPTVPKIAKLDCATKKNHNSSSSSNAMNFKNHHHSKPKNGAVNFGSIASKRSLYMRKLDLPPKFATTLNSTHKGQSLPQAQQPTQQLQYTPSNNNTGVVTIPDGQISSSNVQMCPQPQLNSAVAAVALHPSQVQAYVHTQQPNSVVPGHVSGLNMGVVPIPVSAAPLQMAIPKTNIEMTALSHNTNFGLPNPNNLHGHGHLAPGQFALQPGAVLPAVGSHSLLAATQFALHDQLLMKHAELQRQIIQQQEELRRVSEQLLMAQYPPMQNDPHAQVLIPQAVTQQIPQQQHCIQPAVQQQQVSMDDASGHLHGHTNLFHYQTSVMGYTTGGQPPTSGHDRAT